MPNTKTSMDFLQVEKQIQDINRLLEQQPLNEDEERTLNIPLFIPESIYKKLQKEKCIEDIEYALTRKYETDYGLLWQWFNNINFNLIPITSKTDYQNDIFEKSIKMLTTIDRIISNPNYMNKPEYQKLIPSNKTVLIRFEGEQITFDVRDNADITIKGVSKLIG